jgi:hypothetical protein
MNQGLCPALGGTNLMNRSSAWKRVLLECFDVEGTAPKACCKSPFGTSIGCRDSLGAAFFKEKPRERSLADRGLYRKRSTGSEAFVSAYCLLKRLGFLTVRVSLSRTQPEKKAASARRHFLPVFQITQSCRAHTAVRGALWEETQKLCMHIRTHRRRPARTPSGST